jgi:L-alanine-DL-glutamate epimerase-like enolase superfamily enzyme
MSNITRRDFIKAATAVAAVGAVAGPLSACKSFAINKKVGGVKKMKMTFRPMELEMRHTFTISGFSRDVTPTMLVELSYDGYTGYGEAGLPPYMIGQTPETAGAFLSKVDLEQFSSPFELDDILTYVNGIEDGFSCPKAAVDVALHDLIGKMLDIPVWRYFGYDAAKAPYTSYTIGIDTEEVVRQKTLEAEPYKILKVKLGVDEDTDKKLVTTIRSISDKPMVVDANQGWKDKHLALEMINWLAERGIQMVEQPMPKTVFDDMAWVTEQSPIPTYADESCQRLGDVPKLHGVFDGINIKLLKCTGLYEARKMVSTAEALGMKFMIGCTSETSCAVSAAAQLAPKADFADLDGNLLISNDIFDGMKIVDGKITLNDRPGIGIELIK